MLEFCNGDEVNFDKFLYWECRNFDTLIYVPWRNSYEFLYGTHQPAFALAVG